MSDPRRLLDDETELTPEERRALRAGVGARPPASAKHDVRRALSAAIGAGVLASGTTASGALVGISFAKGLIVGLVVGGGVSVGVIAFQKPEAPVPVPVAAPAAVSAAPLQASDLAPRAIVAPSAEAPAAPKPAQRSFGKRVIESPSPAEPPSQPSTGTLPDVVQAPQTASSSGRALVESRRVAEARALLRRGDARGALALLERTRSEFPNGVLVQEREALAIEALGAAGDRAAARARAAEFLKRYPESPHAASVRAALAN